MTEVNDIVLIHLEESPVSFARVESIEPDAKKDWYHIKLLMLQIPLQVVTWILKDDYINGAEFFMNGKQMRLKKIQCPDENRPEEGLPPLSSKQTEQDPLPRKKAPGEKGLQEKGKIISFSDLKNKDPQ